MRSSATPARVAVLALASRSWSPTVSSGFSLTSPALLSTALMRASSWAELYGLTT
ncbi:hypothetical protein AB0B45_32240 [Nonomuraea sp. NPDC049152]|uniref:hypothetical protein n=1 Tax=Nonomuraea sp. NPDC049152 TaxID=3154350 RepID=UPI0033E6F8A6